MMCVEVGGQLCTSVLPFNFDMIPGNKTQLASLGDGKSLYLAGLRTYFNTSRVG